MLEKPAVKLLLCSAISMASLGQVQALEFYSSGIEGSFDSQISLGSSWRLASPSQTLMTNSSNGNDGDGNYKKGEVFSQVFKGSHDLQLNYQNVGAFVRAKYWSDNVLRDKEGSTPNVNKNQLNQKFDSDGFNDLSQASGFALLDAFVYGSFELNQMSLDLRLGKQVVSWGESTFIGGGVNNINPYDVNEFTRPGATLKEGLLPINMAFGSIGLSDSLSAEAFYQLEFQETVLPGCGTFFATNDYAPQGCEFAITDESLLDFDPTARAARSSDDKPGSDGQFGLALRYISPELGDTELGFYYMNIHSRIPMVNIVKGDNWQDSTQAGDYGTALYLNTLDSSYQISYPKDIQLAGISFATTVGTMALSGEVTHKLDVPVQLNGSQLVAAALTADADLLDAMGMTSSELLADVAAVANGDVVLGYRKLDMTQLQMTAISLFDQVGPISRITVVAEAAMSFLHGLDGSDDRNIFGGNDADGEGFEEGFYTRSAWGYRAFINAAFTDVVAGINLTPSLSLAHDVRGYSDNFTQGQKKVGVTLKADYQSSYSASISYQEYFGGEQSVVHDRDFASITLGMQF